VLHKPESLEATDQIDLIAQTATSGSEYRNYAHPSSILLSGIGIDKLPSPLSVESLPNESRNPSGEYPPPRPLLGLGSESLLLVVTAQCAINVNALARGCICIKTIHNIEQNKWQTHSACP
jgi:hypothetical protein